MATTYGDFDNWGADAPTSYSGPTDTGDFGSESMNISQLASGNEKVGYTPSYSGGDSSDGILGLMSRNPIKSKIGGGILGTILGNILMPGFGGLIGGYLGGKKAGNIIDRYNLQQYNLQDVPLNQVSIYNEPSGILKANVLDPTQFLYQADPYADYYDPLLREYTNSLNLTP